MILIVLNLLASFASALAAVIALARPAFLSGSKHISSGEVFYIRMYAARSIPFGLAAGLLPFWLAGPAVVCLLLTAAMIQAVVIAFQKADFRMIAGATIGAMTHFLCGFAIM